jgi:DNA-binding beta-propeller fold protein YncE
MTNTPRSEEETRDLSHELGKTLVADLSEQLRVPRAQPPHPAGAVLIALLTDEFAPDYAPPNSAIEIVDLATMNAVGSFSIGQREVTSLAVRRLGSHNFRLYVTDLTNGAVVAFNANSGAVIATVPVAFPRDCVMAPNGHRLYVSADQSIVAIDTGPHTVSKVLQTGSDTPLGISVSPDGSMLAVATTDGGSNPALYLIDASTLTLTARIAITNPGEPTNCATFPNDATFTDTGRVLLWDSNCDNLYQVEVASAAQQTSDTIRMGRDAGSFFNFNNQLSYSTVSDRVHVTKESAELAVMDPAGVTGSAFGGFTGTPFVPSLAPDGQTLFVSVIHRFSGGGADTLDRYDVTSGALTRAVYTFSRSSMSVRDMRMVQ